MMWPTDWKRIEDDPDSFIDICRGRRVQAWGYVVSHAMFLVRFYEECELSGAYLLCKGCEEVSFKTGWQDADLQIDILRTGQDGEVLITDGQRLRVICGWAFWTEAEDLLHLDDSMKIGAD